MSSRASEIFTVRAIVPLISFIRACAAAANPFATQPTMRRGRGPKIGRDHRSLVGKKEPVEQAVHARRRRLSWLVADARLHHHHHHRAPGGRSWEVSPRSLPRSRARNAHNLERPSEHLPDGPPGSLKSLRQKNLAGESQSAIVHAALCWPSLRWLRLPTYRKCPPIQRLLHAGRFCRRARNCSCAHRIGVSRLAQCPMKGHI